MIHDLTNGRLDEIRTFAKEHGLEESLNNTFARLETYSTKGCEVKLFSDFAPLSMEFVITDNGRFVLNGGFIFHGKHDNYGSGSAPTFAVCLEKTVGWSIHT